MATAKWQAGGFRGSKGQKARRSAWSKRAIGGAEDYG